MSNPVSLIIIGAGGRGTGYANLIKALGDSLREIFTLDNTVSELANMPCGYIAERTNKNSKWKIKKK